MRELGFTGWQQSKIAKIETGRAQRILLEEIFALALALSVSPLYLIVPTVGEIQLAGLTFDPITFKQWLRGDEPPIPFDRRTHLLVTRALTPEAEWLHLAEELGTAVEGDR